MTSTELLGKLANPRRIQQLETLNGQRIDPLIPARLEYIKGECYRLCQMMPAVPQRFEWINVKNIREVRS